MFNGNRLFWIVLTVVIGYLIYMLAPILTPFVVGAIFAYMGDPLVDKLEAKKLSRTTSVIIVFLGLTTVLVGAIVILVPMIEKQIVTLTNNIPAYIEVIRLEFIPWLEKTFGLELSFDEKMINETLSSHWQDAGGVISTVITYVSESSLVLIGWLVNLLLIPVVTFYMLRDWDTFVGRIKEFLPRQNVQVICELAKSSDDVLAAFMRGQMMVMFILGFIYSIGLWIVGLDLALLIGMLSGMVSFVPYLGFIVGIAVAGVAVIMQFQELSPLLSVLAVFGVGQLLEGFVLTPLLLGDKIGLHPVAVIFSIMAGGQLFGFIGVLLALPAAAIIAVVLRYWHEQYKNSALYSTK